MEKQCSICGEILANHSAFANHIRWKHTDNSSFREKVKASTSKRYAEINGEFITEIVNCYNCDKPTEIVFRKNKKKAKYYCSRGCSNSRGPRTPEFKQRVSEKIKKAWELGIYDNVDMTSKNTNFSLIKEREILDYFKKTYPFDEWTSGGSISQEGIRISRDMYSKKLKVCFEYDGVWHFKDIHGQLEKKRLKDSALENWCKEKNYRLIRLQEGYFESFAQLEDLIYLRKESLIKIGNGYNK